MPSSIQFESEPANGITTHINHEAIPLSLSTPKIVDIHNSTLSTTDTMVSLSCEKFIPAAHQMENEDEGAHMADLSDSASDTGSRDGGGKDSGCEVTSEITDSPFIPPSVELADKIVTQVEFYFSDANIIKDAFLLKHVKRNKEGYVSLKLISSFKRVKHLTKDWRVVADALSRSSRLELNELGTKLRRKDPLPQYDETSPSRTIFVIDMPLDKITIENVAELFRECGEIALVRILRPENPLPVDVRQFISKHPNLNGVACALIEFVLSESARNAVKLQEKYNCSMKVYELKEIRHTERKKKNVSRHTKPTNNNKGFSQPDITAAKLSENEESRVRFDSYMGVRRGSSSYCPQKCIEPAAWLQRRLSASSTEANFMFLSRRLSQGSRDSSESQLYLPRKLSSCSTSSTDSAVGYFNRRMSSCSYSSDSSSSRSRSNSSIYHLPENIIRMPQGPDGSKGFKERPQIV